VRNRSGSSLTDVFDLSLVFPSSLKSSGLSQPSGTSMELDSLRSDVLTRRSGYTYHSILSP